MYGCSRLLIRQQRSVSLEALEGVPERHDLAAADGPAAIIPDDDGPAVFVRAQHLPLIWALPDPLVEVIREPGGKCRDALHADKIVPLAALRIQLHPALRFQAEVLEVYRKCILHDKSPYAIGRYRFSAYSIEGIKAETVIALLRSGKLW